MTLKGQNESPVTRQNKSLVAGTYSRWWRLARCPVGPHRNKLHPDALSVVSVLLSGIRTQSSSPKAQTRHPSSLWLSRASCGHLWILTRQLRNTDARHPPRCLRGGGSNVNAAGRKRKHPVRTRSCRTHEVQSLHKSYFYLFIHTNIKSNRHQLFLKI